MNAAELLDIWEHGRLLQPSGRAQLLCAFCAAGTDPAGRCTAALPLGATTARLLQLRHAWFGPDIAAIVDCPACDARLEMALRTDDLLAAWNGEQALLGTHAIEVDGVPLHFRLPTLEDLEAVDAGLSAQEAQDQLLHACVHEPVAAASPDVVETLLSEMARLDPLADLDLALSCDACAHRFTIAFDIGTFLWREIEAWGARLLGEIHTIASTYGWSQAEILSLSPNRRQHYLDLICA